MVPSVSITILVVAWVVCIFMLTKTQVFAVGFVATSESSALEQEKKALLESKWWNDYSNDNLSHCKWYGIKCNDSGSITEINMDGPYLGNKFSKFNFSSFSNLVHLNLSRTRLMGSIPHEICTLLKLTYLDLSQNHIIGELPLSLTNLTQSVTFNIFDNLITGSIPKELGNLKNLLDLILSNNHFTRTIPTGIGLLKNLLYLDL